MNIVIAGPKGAGKSTVGKILAKEVCLARIETDEILESIYFEEQGCQRTCREICLREGERAFRTFERRAVEKCRSMDYHIIVTGGETLKDPENRRILRHHAILVYLKGGSALLWSRVKTQGIPAFLSKDNPFHEFEQRVAFLDDVVLPYADIVVENEAFSTPEEIARHIKKRIGEELLLASSRFSSLGSLVQLHTFGESHGTAMGAVLDGIPAGIQISLEDIQKELDRRRPGQSKISTPRSEPDRVRIVSGIFEGKTTGAPIALLIENTQQRPGDYEAFHDKFRPGHADFTFWKKFGIRDYRGGGRSSGRETASRVMGGAIAKRILSDRGMTIRAYALEIGGVKAERINYDCIESNSVRCPDPDAALAMEEKILEAQRAQDSIGGIVQVEICGVPAGLGDPVFAKLDARLGGAFFSIGAVKGVEFGCGFAAARLRGSAHNDPMANGRFVTNNAGGILGGISTGEMIVARIAIKPTPSIGIIQKTMDVRGIDTEVAIQGRHDPCIVPRIIPVIESMAALVLLDCLMIQEALCAKRPKDVVCASCHVETRIPGNG